MTDLLTTLLSWKASILELGWSARMGFAGLTSLLIVFAVFRPFHRMMQRLKYGEVIREGKDVEKLHALHAGKKDTVTMGGVMLLVAVTVSALIWAPWNVYILSSLFVYLSFGLIGFADDYLKVTKRNKKGLDGKLKMLGQLIIAAMVFGVLMYHPVSSTHLRELWVPLSEEPLIPEMPYWMAFALLFLVLAATSNTVNLTDGADGLAIGCSISAIVAFAVIAYMAGAPLVAEGLNLAKIAGAEEISVLCSSLLGAGFAFLWFNGHPARVFMGDTGSLSLGGVIGIIAFLLNQPLILFLVGAIFVLEGLSVIIQVASFQLFRRRVFLMSPLHHHFEIAGWPESRVVIRFWIVSIISGILGVWTFTL
ncbi:MAG: phospho-N-acetylmuramoyl-pentapeptide-transferase [Opitutales bacterium]|nr:phospho-N-acetylmuramoyl-pentapeptide-transferase [Opitutales bacterium]